MPIIAGVDIGNATTEVALARVEDGSVDFISSSIAYTTGIKGTLQNVTGVRRALSLALEQAGWPHEDFKRIDIIRLNKAAPVIGDVAMETITETIITESTMIGHNPSTPGGVGIGVGRTISIYDLEKTKPEDPVVVVIPESVSFEEAANMINLALSRGIAVNGVICQSDDGVLIANRINKTIPIVDEVKAIDRVPLGMQCCVEVAPPGRSVELLSNPYGIATIFGLSSDETRQIVPVAKALIGNRSAVVIRTPLGEVKERRIPAGELYILGPTGKRSINIDEGAEAIMEIVDANWPITDIFGQPGTNVGGMMERVRKTMSELTGLPLGEIHIKDLLAVDTMVPQRVVGGLAEEFAMETGVALAVMVEAQELPMQKLASAIESDMGVKVEIGGVEAEMAVLGALTTPGTDAPLAVLDLGAGSTDASLLRSNGQVELIHLAGAGNMVNTIISSELGIDDMELVENIKEHPLCKVESVFHVRLEDGTVRFFEKPLAPELFGRVALMIKEDFLSPILLDTSIEKIRDVRRKAKKEVFVTNALRALKRVAPAQNIRLIDFVVLVGGSALDFEIPSMITEELAKYSVVAGRGNIRGSLGPRNAVATGLVLSSAGRKAL
ncbi:diol dehydratase reactivase subunit alpha [Acetomicrobium hydrogeniformans]|uniref:Glycerol dehydratase reactivation factor, large subunit n=1 Tax=Acetomicrobium hydrogeniformans ATCC BAA-1850 TaxID=592015 RepID=A0A0T5XAW0_9BACT|nr:diol dehydratase reactivase subunit alpha [Acetomicrobium hydrogeniformans]KRT35462.1 glycerol dehydratase reactivation factor, large subunit [Acetomicrobium hydrogeniformans ATCC BAA-1850]